jgi:hypothetical protein
MKMYYLESRSRGISYMKYVNGRQTGLVTFYVETAFYEEDKEEDVGSYWMTLRKGQDTLI